MDDHDSNLEVTSYNLTPDTFDKVLQKQMLQSFSLTHVNIRSLQKNVNEINLLYEHILKSKFDVICLSEVWKVQNTAALGLTGYNLEVKCRQDELRGGGVGAYIRSSIKYSTLDYDVLHAESLWFDMNVNGCRVIVGIIYRKPNTDISEFQDSLLNVLGNLKIDKLQCILLGDFNINLLVSDNKVEQFQSGLQCMGMQQLITSPTRVTKNTSSLIDHIYTNLIASGIHACRYNRNRCFRSFSYLCSF